MIRPKGILWLWQRTIFTLPLVCIYCNMPRPAVLSSLRGPVGTLRTHSAMVVAFIDLMNIESTFSVKSNHRHSLYGGEAYSQWLKKQDLADATDIHGQPLALREATYTLIDFVP
jgi:hypothetical protein